MLHDVVQRLLGDPVERVLDLDRESLDAVGDDGDREPDPALERRGVRAQRADDAVLGEAARPELEDQRAHLGQGVALQLAEGGQLRPGLLRVAREHAARCCG